MYLNSIKNNPLKTKKDLQDACNDMITPVLKHFSPGKAHLNIGSTSAHYKTQTVGLEGFARVLWGLAPLLSGGYSGFNDIDIFITGLANGCNPKHKEYWGDLREMQRCIEQAAIGLTLSLIPEKIWDTQSSEDKNNIEKWLAGANQVKYHPNNQTFMNLIVNCGLKKIGSDNFDIEKIKNCQQTLEEMYIGDGWYQEGPAKAYRPRDYYIPFAYHFYGLIYSKLAEDFDPEMSAKYKQRAKEFSKDYVYWFDKQGRALPYGRSLTYRFALGAFWAGCAFAGVEGIPWGQCKSIYLKHLRWWFTQPIFTETGIQTIGYAYPNLHIQEQYNSPTSPYWSFKAMLALNEDENHPFWSADEEDIKKENEIVSQEKSFFIFCETKNSGHLVGLCAGQNPTYELCHRDEKYNKFAYSTHFGFNVPLSSTNLDGRAVDNMLLLSEDEAFWRHCVNTLNRQVNDNYLYFEWEPWQNVKIKTYIIPCMPWHARVHIINTEKPLFTIEGGFAIEKNDNMYYDLAEFIDNSDFKSMVHEKNVGISGIADPSKKRNGKHIDSFPNSNLLFSRCFIPAIRGQIDTGESALISLVLGEPDHDKGLKTWTEMPDINKITSILPEDIQAKLK